MIRRHKHTDCPGCAAVAKRGIIIGSAQRGPRLLESSRLAALATIRSARARRALTQRDARRLTPNTQAEQSGSTEGASDV